MNVISDSTTAHPMPFVSTQEAVFSVCVHLVSLAMVLSVKVRLC